MPSPARVLASEGPSASLAEPSFRPRPWGQYRCKSQFDVGQTPIAASRLPPDKLLVPPKFFTRKD